MHDPQSHLAARELRVRAGLVTHGQVVRDDEISLSPLRVWIVINIMNLTIRT